MLGKLNKLVKDVYNKTKVRLKEQKDKTKQKQNLVKLTSTAISCIPVKHDRGFEKRTHWKQNRLLSEKKCYKIMNTLNY